MSRQHLVRVGALGRVGRFTSVDAMVYPRSGRVVVRTGRGLELGEVLTPPGVEPNGAASDGSILRGMTIEDQLLEARLEQNRQAALQACAARLAEADLPVTLLDAEQLFDGRTLVFYFLGEVTPDVERLTDELASAYEAQVQIGKFAETLLAGCGPGCGTAEATGAGCQSCAVGCAVSGACHTDRK